MCRRSVAVLSLLLIFLFSSFAFAEDGSLGGDLLPEAVNNPTVQRIGLTDTYFVYAPSNEFDAALAIIGETSTKIQLDTPKFTALSNEATGGDFYDLAQLCYNAEEGNPVNPASAIWYPMVQAKIELFGASHVWFCQATREQINAAHRDYMTVLNGGSQGGSGSNSGVLTRYSVGTTSGVVYDGSVYDPSTNQVTSSTSNSRVAYDNLPLSIKYCYSENTWFKSKFDQLVSQSSGPYFVQIYMNNYVYMASLSNVTYQISNDTLNLSSSVQYTRFRLSSGPFNIYSTASYGNLFIDNRHITDYNRTSNTTFFTLSDSYYTTDFTGVGGGGGGGGGGGDTNNWPEPTPIATPTAPEVPAPDVGDPVTDPPEPTDITFSPTLVVAPTGTSPTDYTPWLSAILQALNTIIDDMARHCDHIKVAIRDWTQWLSQRIDYLMYEYLDNLQTYLHQLFEWLANEISFNFDTGDFPLYDDTRLISWLRRIYYQLGSPVKRTTNPPTDKDVEESFDFWAWLLGLINRYLGGLIEDFVGDIGGFISELVNTFPFSIPWDILAYLTLLDAQRETPRIVVTIPAVAGWWSSYDIVIDCAPYNGTMATVRAMILIWWGFSLLMRTNWLDEIFKSSTSLVTGFFDRITGKAVTD